MSKNTGTGFWIICMLIMLIGGYSCHRQVKENREREAIRQQEREEWRKSPAGLDYAARMRSEMQRKVVFSPTGKIFFLGEQCSGDCSGHIAGYDWATDIGITKESACESAYDSTNSQSFYEGCVHGVKDVISSFDPNW